MHRLFMRDIYKIIDHFHGFFEFAEYHKYVLSFTQSWDISTGYNAQHHELNSENVSVLELTQKGKTCILRNLGSDNYEYSKMANLVIWRVKNDKNGIKKHSTSSTSSADSMKPSFS